MEKQSYTKLIFYSILIAIAIFLILLLKAITFVGFYSIIYLYTLGITTFMFSRVLGSVFYETPKIKDPHFEPTVSFIIPCKNEEKWIYNTIIKCFKTDYDQNKIESIVINDGSTDNTLSEMLRAKKDLTGRKVIIINWRKNKGKREGMAEGFRRAKGEIVIQLDSDSYLEKNALKLIVAPFINKKFGAVVGHTLPSNKDENMITKMQTAYYFMSFRALKATESLFNMVFCCSGCFSAYRKSYVLPVLDRWLKEKFMGRRITFGDDRALTNKMLERGYKTIYHNRANAFTIVPNTLKKFLKQQVRWKKGWFINSIRALKFVIEKDPFVAFTYFIPLVILTLITPIMVFKALIIDPMLLGIIPFAYVIGVILVSLLLYLHFKIYGNKGDIKYGKYMFLWSILNMTIFSYILVYALYDIKNMGWGTR